MELTLNLPDSLALQLQSVSQEELQRVIEMGIRECSTPDPAEFRGLSEVLETLARLPSPEEVMALRPSPALEKRIGRLLEKNRTVGLNVDEEREWRHYEYVEHLVRMAKAQAALKLRRT
jgi:hypothetical protein